MARYVFQMQPNLLRGTLRESLLPHASVGSKTIDKAVDSVPVFPIIPRVLVEFPGFSESTGSMPVGKLITGVNLLSS